MLTSSFFLSIQSPSLFGSYKQADDLHDPPWSPESVVPIVAWFFFSSGTKVDGNTDFKGFQLRNHEVLPRNDMDLNNKEQLVLHILGCKGLTISHSSMKIFSLLQGKPQVIQGSTIKVHSH